MSRKKGKANGTDKVLGENLRFIRLSRSLNQQELAEKTGITFQQIQKYERGANRISASRLLQFSEILDVDLKSFYDGLLADNKDISVLAQIDPEILKLAVLLQKSDNKDLIKAIKKLVKTMASGVS